MRKKKGIGATVSRTADRWLVAIQIAVSDDKAKLVRKADGMEGVDFGIKAAVSLSNGESIKSPKPLKCGLRRLKIRGRSVRRKCEAAKKSK